MPPAFRARSAALLVLTVLGAVVVADPEAALPEPAGALDAATSALSVGTVVAVPVAATALVVVEGYWLA
jgi:hypothetical protein